MTCTTHHICDCQKDSVEKVLKSLRLIRDRDRCAADFAQFELIDREVKKALKELES